MIDIALPLLRTTGLMAFVVLGYSFVLTQWKGLPDRLVLGVVCGFGAILSMLDPAEIAPGVLIDARTTLVMLSAFFGGPVAVAITGTMAAVFRAYLGGAGAVAGITILAISAVLGIAAHYLLKRRGTRVRHRDLALFALVAPIASLGVFALPIEIAWPVFVETVVPVNAVRILGVFFLGALILNEHRRIEAERNVRRLAFEDELSGLSNRRAFYRDLDRAWARWQRDRQPFSLIMIDIDHFKAVNDRHGHPTGDEVIRALADIMKEECRRYDMAARLGGEEFALLLPNADCIAGAAVAERIRQITSAQGIQAPDGQDVRFTASFGVSAPTAAFADRLEALSSADQALYDAKNAGRNCVVVDGEKGRLYEPVAAATPLPTIRSAGL